MAQKQSVRPYQKAPILEKLCILVSQSQQIYLKGLIGSSKSFIFSELFTQLNQPIVWILTNKEEASYFFNDLELQIGTNNVLFFPASYRRPYEIDRTDNSNILLRAETLKRIKSQKKPSMIVTYPEALFEQVVTKQELEKKTLSLHKGEKVSIEFINETLFEYLFKRVDFVTEPGEFSVRGGILDVFSFDNEVPYRIEFFGNEVDSIRTFDIESQLSDKTCSRITILADVEQKHAGEKRQAFLAFLNSKTLIIHQGIELIQRSLDSLFDKALQSFKSIDSPIEYSPPDDLFCDQHLFNASLKRFTQIDADSYHKESIGFSLRPQPSFNRKFDLFIADLQHNQKNGYKNFIFCASEEQKDRLNRIFGEVDILYKAVVQPIYKGFIDDHQKIVCYSDHEVFERYHTFNIRKGFTKKQSISLQEFNRLSMGDYVTHIDHGIGKFGGLQRIEVEGKFQEAIKLIYGERDILYVSIHALHKISKYNGKDGTVPNLHKLGSGVWKRLKQKTKKRVKEIAFNLIETYAKRRLKKGFQYAPDSYLQHELEASFMYEDTPDQQTSTQDVKNDMESELPMDRLVCGDVGFGKTEIAIRAAFKAIDNGKQVAILVPTTILAFQHYNTFSSRLSEFPVRVDYLNRFRTAKDRRLILEDLANGSIDLIIGTHQLVNKKVSLKNLGLLIVDEEQKFGVGVKEKLRALKENVDVLTLTATPIPRTLQFSLMAARDLSIINTPPPNRYPIESQVVGFQEELFRDAVSYELQRRGQVFFIHNRIENLKEIGGLIQRLVPDAKIACAHGQMEGKKLEAIMIDFIDGRYDVLVSTTIIESGLDVPNANTIFINNAHQFGLSDLHQMRGRVGRSNKKAFCYFITAPYSTLTDDARRRIRALEQHTALGSGFQIAMKDLEIRGAGDLLGGEQSGFINEIGFETYQKILKEAIEELKEKEFKALYDEEPKIKREVQIDTDFEVLFPDTYINNIQERLAIYQELAQVSDQKEMETFKNRLLDRFGPLPQQAQELLKSVQLKWLASGLSFEKLILKKQKLIGYFVNDTENSFYQSGKFQKIIQRLQRLPSAKMKEKNGKLLLVFDAINTLDDALKTLRYLVKN